MFDLNYGPIQTMHFDFHGFFRLSIQTGDPRIVRYFQLEYGQCQVESVQPVDLEVIFESEPVRPDANTTSFGPFRLASQGRIYGAGRHKVARWDYAIEGIEAPTTRLVGHAGFMGLEFLRGLIEQIIMHKLACKGVLLVHAACIAKNGTSILIPALGDIGKTALAICLVQHGWQFQSDDYTFLSESGETFSLPRRLHISYRTEAACPGILPHLSLRQRTLLTVKRLIFYLSLRYADLWESVSLHDLAPSAETVKSARLGAVLVLKRSSGTTISKPEKLTLDALRARILAINGLERLAIDQLLLAEGYRSVTNPLAESWERRSAIAMRALKNVPAFEIAVPTRPRSSAAMFQELVNVANLLAEHNAPPVSNLA